MVGVFVAERAVSPASGVERWVVADARTYALHEEATAFLAGLRSKGRSPNTERVYAGRVALYLTYCHERRIEWAAPGFLALSGLQPTPHLFRIAAPHLMRSWRGGAVRACGFMVRRTGRGTNPAGKGPKRTRSRAGRPRLPLLLAGGHLRLHRASRPRFVAR